MVSLKEARHHSLQRVPRDPEIQSMAGHRGDRKIFWRSCPNCADFVEQAAGQVHEHAVDFCKAKLHKCKCTRSEGVCLGPRVQPGHVVLEISE